MRFCWYYGGFSWFSGGVPGFLGSVPGFLGEFQVFWGVFRVLGGVPGCSDVPGSTTCLDYAYSHPVEVSNDQMDYHEYFRYVMNEPRLAPPNDWKDAFELFRKITDAAVNGN